MNYERISRLAESYSALLNSRNPVDLANYLHLIITEESFPDHSTRGVLIRRQYRWIVVVDAELGKQDKDDVIAHECAHFLLHRHVFSQCAVRAQEIEADAFSRAYLLPRVQLLDSIVAHGLDPTALARAMRVRRIVVEKRLQDLGW